MILSLCGVDIPCDIRDIVAEMIQLAQGEEVPWWQIVLDVVAFVPVVGSLKYLDEAGTILKGTGKNIDNGVEWISDATKLEKGMGDVDVPQKFATI